MFSDLRENSVEELTALDFPGNAIGGLSVGESIETRLSVAQTSLPLLPEKIWDRQTAIWDKRIAIVVRFFHSQGHPLSFLLSKHYCSILFLAKYLSGTCPGFVRYQKR